MKDVSGLEHEPVTVGVGSFAVTLAGRMVLAGLGLLPGLATATQILEHKNVRISVADEQTCSPGMKVRFDGDSLDTFHRSRIDMQAVAKVARAYLWLDCPELEKLEYDGYVNEELVYQAESVKRDAWVLVERTEDSQQPTAATDAEVDDPDRSASLKEPPAPVAEDPSERLQHARAQLGLAEAPVGAVASAARDHAVETLEALAREGNAAAVHALAEAYLKHPDIPVNVELVQSVTRIQPQVGDRLRSMAAALLTLKAAEQGSPGAIGALNSSGRSGSSDAYYALGTMYMLDRDERMPRSRGFLRKQLRLKRTPSGTGHVDVGLHFMQLAASAGHEAAMAMLDEVGEPYDRDSAGGATTAQTAATTAEASDIVPMSATATNLSEQADSALAATTISQLLEPGTAQTIAQSTSSSRAAQAGSASSATGTTATSGIGRQRGARSSSTPAAPGSSVSGSGPAAGRAVAAQTRRRSSRESKQTQMDSEIGEAEIID